ncbi:hypothetical protein GCM10023143_22460 [Compostibacter hankyongensis]|uniref:DUF5683 domain-containing protein n=2 Tax=Compostibacter hankyongensis TaxID=1007089 RepID=A0ABP8FWX7_9BACT
MLLLLGARQLRAQDTLLLPATDTTGKAAIADSAARAALPPATDSSGKTAADTIARVNAPSPADSSRAPADTLKPVTAIFTHTVLDSLRKVHNPRKAILYSAVLPGLGQAYNHQYIKIPLMYAGIGTATGIFIFNYKYYIQYRDAYRLMLNGKPTGIPRIDNNPGSYSPETVKYVRDAYRQYVDYSVLGFAAAYLYNIIDAIVFAHLYRFDVSNDLSWRMGPVVCPGYTGVGVTLTF